MVEPNTTGLFLAAIGGLLAVSVIFSRASERFGVPVVLAFLGLGMLAGSEGIGGIEFHDAQLAYRLGTAALVLILFDGGLHTRIPSVRAVAAPALLLASFGVVATAALVALAAVALGVPWSVALLVGAVVSSTDAATVFSVLRGSGLSLKRRVGTTLEVESGINDPMAVILTIALTEQLLHPADVDGGQFVLDMAIQFALGIGIGVAAGFASRWLLRRVSLSAGGLYPVLTIGLVCLVFGGTTMLNGSGFLAVYIVGLVLGDGPLPYRHGLLRVHDAVAWLAQVAMFLVLGLLVFPSRLVEVAGVGLLLSAFLAVVGRPLVVALCLLPFRYQPREVAYIGWVGLRGAVPIVLATYPLLRGAPEAEWVFNLVFFIVVSNALVPGGTVAWVTRRLGLQSHEPEPPRAVLEIQSAQSLRGDLRSFYVEPALPACGVALSELPFPAGAAATLLVRGSDLIAPKGDTVLQPGDHVYVFAQPEDFPFIQLMFGRPEAD